MGKYLIETYKIDEFNYFDLPKWQFNAVQPKYISNLFF